MRVSIRAPVRTPGRPGSRSPITSRISGFNPRPGADTGATRNAGRQNGRHRGFNPRPGADTGATYSDADRLRYHRPGFNPRPGADTGATEPLGPAMCRRIVSIRAPVRTPGRRAKGLMGFDPHRFQSAPRCGHRGDPAFRRSVVWLECFNPRPGADTGATDFGCEGRGHLGSFNPRPGADTGATLTCWNLQEVVAFQSAPRCGHRGDPRHARPSRLLSSFNPRPGADTGATRRRARQRLYRDVSIRAPVRTPGRLPTREWTWRALRVSIRAPVRTPGRRRASRRATARVGFNPRPGADTGATAKRHSSSSGLVVSIRAPVRTPGRP